MNKANKPEKINIFIYWVCLIYRWMLTKKRKYIFSYDFPKEQYINKPVLFLCDHPAYDSWINLLAGWSMDRRLRAVVGAMHLYTPKVGILVRLTKCIPMKTFVSDITSTRDIIRASKRGQSILLFPEGIYSYAGITHPIMPATAKLIKLLGMDVVLVTSNGAYLTKPRYSDDVKVGRIEVNYHLMFTKEELIGASIDDIKERLFNELRYNDFEWNERKNNSYPGKESNIKGLEKIIYHCPKCHCEGTLVTSENEMRCTHCNNTIIMDDTYHIERKTDNDYLPFERVDQWYLYQRRIERDTIRNNDSYVLEFNVELNELNKKFGSMFKTAGEGVLQINRDGTTYSGTRNGEEVNYFFPIKDTYGASNQKNKYLVLFNDNELLAFDLGNNANLINKASSTIEEFHALVDSRWDEALVRAYYNHEVANT